MFTCPVAGGNFPVHLLNQQIQNKATEFGCDNKPITSVAFCSGNNSHQNQLVQTTLCCFSPAAFCSEYNLIWVIVIVPVNLDSDSKEKHLFYTGYFQKISQKHTRLIVRIYSTVLNICNRI